MPLKRQQWQSDRGILNVFEESLTVIRAPDGRRNEYGEWVESGERTHEVVTGNSQPLSRGSASVMIESLPEGWRISEYRTFWLPTSVSITPVTATNVGDWIRRDGKDYKIIGVDYWDGFNRAVGAIITIRNTQSLM